MEKFYLHWYAKGAERNPSPSDNECYRLEYENGGAIDGVIYFPQNVNLETDFGYIAEEILYKISDFIKFYHGVFCGMVRSFRESEE